MSKKKTILILSRRDDRPDFDTAESMARMLQSAKSDVQYEPCFLEEVAFVYDGEKLRVTNMRDDRDLATYDGIFLLGWFKKRKQEEVALAVSLYAQKHGVKTYNTEALHNRSRSKISQYVQSVLRDVSTTPFVMITDSKFIVPLVERSNLEYPLIAKSVTASRGSHNYLVRNREELEQALAAAPTKAFVVQTFVPNDGDYRLLVMGDAVRLIIHRRAADDTHLNNTSQGGKATLIEPADVSPDMLADAVKIAHTLRREVTGVDMIVHNETGEYFFLEANNMPQLSTGSFVPEKAQALATHFAQWVDSE